MSFAAAQAAALAAGFDAFAEPLPGALLTGLAVTELDVVFQAGYVGAPGVATGAERLNPSAEIRTADAPADLARGDLLELNDRRYPIVAIRPNTDGTTSLILGFSNERPA